MEESKEDLKSKNSKKTRTHIPVDGYKIEQLRELRTRPHKIATLKGSLSKGTAIIAAIKGAKVTILPVLNAPKRLMAST